MERKNLIELLGSLFVALIFLTSYAAYGISNSKAKVAATTTAPPTFYAEADTNATIKSYGQILMLNVSCANATGVETRLNNLLLSYEQNNTVSNFYSPQNNQFVIDDNSNSYAIYNSMLAGLKENSTCVDFVAQGQGELRSTIVFYVAYAKSNVTVSVPDSLRGFSTPLTLSGNILSKLNVSVATLITANGTIYGNMTVTRV